MAKSRYWFSCREGFILHNNESNGQCVPSSQCALQVPQLLILVLRILQGLSGQVCRFFSPPNPEHSVIKGALAPQQVHLAIQCTFTSFCSSIHFTFVVVAITAIRAVWPNLSLNRTYCGGPVFGLKKPSPNTSPPQ